MPERLRLNNYRPTPVKGVEVKPPSPSVDTQLAPLKVSKAKQSPVPLNVKSQHTSPASSSPREAGTPESNEGGKQWARKAKVKTDPLALSPVGFVFTRVIAVVNVRSRECSLTYLCICDFSMAWMVHTRPKLRLFSSSLRYTAHRVPFNRLPSFCVTFGFVPRSRIGFQNLVQRSI